jgi:hypothetical protein
MILTNIFTPNANIAKTVISVKNQLKYSAPVTVTGSSISMTFIVIPLRSNKFVFYSMFHVQDIIIDTDRYKI